NGDSIECGIRDLSETGAQLEVRGPIPNVFDLIIDCDQSRHTCYVIWRKVWRIGVTFQERHHLARTLGSLGVSELRQHAEECRMLAKQAEPSHREELIKMALTWEALDRRQQKKKAGQVNIPRQSRGL